VNNKDTDEMVVYKMLLLCFIALLTGVYILIFADKNFTFDAPIAFFPSPLGLWGSVILRGMAVVLFIIPPSVIIWIIVIGELKNLFRKFR